MLSLVFVCDPKLCVTIELNNYIENSNR